MAQLIKVLLAQAQDYTQQSKADDFIVLRNAT